MTIAKSSLFLFNILFVSCLRNPKEIEYLEKETLTPSFDELKTVIESALKKNFDYVAVEITNSPDLREDPFHLASPGIGGDPIIIEYGSDNYMVPFADKSKVYNLIPMIREISSYEDKEFFACGAGAGPFDWAQQNCEGIYNLKVHQNGSVRNENHIARTTASGIEVLKVPNNETRAAILGNIFLSEGKMGAVLKVVCRNRTGEEDFISAMRKGLTDKYSQNQIVGLGGVFVMKEGNASVYVMNDFIETPIITPEDRENWLTFHEMPAPLIALGVFVSQETDFQLRLQHFHCFSNHNHGGHFQYDITPEIVEYEGYFNVVERVILIDKNSAIATTENNIRFVFLLTVLSNLVS